MDFLNSQKYSVPAAPKAKTKMAPMAYAGNEPAEYDFGIAAPAVGSQGIRDITIKEINVNMRDFSIDAATYARFKREQAYNISKAVCDAVRESRNL